MERKEREGGLLRNEDIERELERTGANEAKSHGYRGIQDTGDDIIREQGTKVQREDGIGAEGEDENT